MMCYIKITAHSFFFLIIESLSYLLAIVLIQTSCNCWAFWRIWLWLLKLPAIYFGISCPIKSTQSLICRHLWKVCKCFCKGCSEFAGWQWPSGRHSSGTNFFHLVLYHPEAQKRSCFGLTLWPFFSFQEKLSILTLRN